MNAVPVLHTEVAPNDPGVPALIVSRLRKESGDLRILHGHPVNESGDLRIVRCKAVILGGYARDVREITRFEIRPAKMDFQLSEQGIVDVTQLWADDLLIVNALELVDWEDSLLQLIVCEACGSSGCGADGYVSIQRTEGLVLLLPSFADMEANDLVSFGPPRVLESAGALVLKTAQYQELRNLIPGFPAEAGLPPLTGKEAADLFQWEAPGGILGSFPQRRALDRARLIACSEGDLRERLDFLEEALGPLRGFGGEVALRPVEAGEEIVSFFLDDRDFTEWRALAETPNGPALCLAPGYVIELP